MIYYTTSINLTHEAAAKEHCQRLRTESARMWSPNYLRSLPKDFSPTIGDERGIIIQT